MVTLKWLILQLFGLDLQRVLKDLKVFKVLKVRKVI